MLYYAVAPEHLGPQTVAVLMPKRFAPRILFTVYPFVMGIKNKALLRHCVQKWEDRPVIVDSGIFTMNRTLLDMPEAKRPAFLREYSKKYLDVLDVCGYKGVLVDVDCQRLVPYEEYLKLREMFEPLQQRCMFVWHPQGGKKNLVDLLRFPRVGLSARDMKEIAPAMKQKAGNVCRTATALLRAVGDDIDTHHFHLLGTTMEEQFKLPDNWTCDSVSWGAAAFWGRSHSGMGAYEVRDLGKGRVDASPHIKAVVGEELQAMMRAYTDTPGYSRRNPTRVKYIRMMAVALYAQQLLVQTWQRRYGTLDEGTRDPLSYIRKAAPNGVNKGKVKEAAGRR